MTIGATCNRRPTQSVPISAISFSFSTASFQSTVSTFYIVKAPPESTGLLLKMISLALALVTPMPNDTVQGLTDSTIRGLIQDVVSS